MEERGLHRRCLRCDTGGKYSAEVMLCPLCGQLMESESDLAGDGLVELLWGPS